MSFLFSQTSSVISASTGVCRLLESTVSTSEHLMSVPVGANNLGGAMERGAGACAE